MVDLLALAAGAKVEESCQLLTVDAFLVDADLVGMSQVSVSELLLSVELFYLIVINFDYLFELSLVLEEVPMLNGLELTSIFLILSLRVSFFLF